MYKLKRAIDIKKIENQTAENCFFAVVKSKGEYIKYILNPSEDLVKLAIRINGSNIRFIPDEMKTLKICELAAIHEAPLSLLPKTNKQIENIVEYLLWLRKREEEIISLRGHQFSRSLQNFRINGEWTNFSKRFSNTLIVDCPELLKFWVENGYDAFKNDAGDIYFKDDKISSANTLFGCVYPKAVSLTPDLSASNFIDEDGTINTKIIEKAIRNKPESIFELDEKYITNNFVDIAISNNLAPEKLLELPKGYDDVVKKSVSRKISRYWHISNEYEDLIKAAFKYCESDMTDFINENIDKSPYTINIFLECIFEVDEMIYYIKRSMKKHVGFYYSINTELEYFSKVVILTNIVNKSKEFVDAFIKEFPYVLNILSEDFIKKDFIKNRINSVGSKDIDAYVDFLCTNNSLTLYKPAFNCIPFKKLDFDKIIEIYNKLIRSKRAKEFENFVKKNEFLKNIIGR